MAYMSQKILDKTFCETKVLSKIFCETFYILICLSRYKIEFYHLSHQTHNTRPNLF